MKPVSFEREQQNRPAAHFSSIFPESGALLVRRPTGLPAIAAAILLCAAASLLQGSPAEFGIEVTPGNETYAPGDTVLIAVKATIPNKHHLYGNPLGPGIGKPLSVGINGAAGVAWFDIIKAPATKYTPTGSEWVWAYEKEAYFVIRGIAGDTAGRIDGYVVFDGLICHTACLPINKKAAFSIDIDPKRIEKPPFATDKKIGAGLKALSEVMLLASAAVSTFSAGSDLSALNIESLLDQPEPHLTEWDYSPREQKVEFNFLLAILFGFLAGMILNVMPCVLPVLGIKILSFAQSQKGSRRSAVLRSIAFSGGMISVFMVLASFAAFANFSWGQQFQNPKVLVAIIGLMVIFALGMFDVFMIMVPSAISGLDRKSGSGMTGDFFKGMFATVLATPCSGPLLGATLAWTLTQMPIVIFTVFMSIGVGMAFPYVLFSASKRLTRLIPKPGTWMQDFKYLMGFVLLGMAVYLMIGLPKDMIISTIGFCLFLAFAVALYTRFVPWGCSLKRKALMILPALGVAGLGFYVNFSILYSSVSDEAVMASEENTGKWQEFSPELLKSAHANGKHVLVDFTANWCLNCQFNKVAVLHTSEVAELLKSKDVVAIKADLTRPNPDIESLRDHLGSRSVPFLALFPGDRPYEPVVMRDLLNKKAVIRALQELDDPN